MATAYASPSFTSEDRDDVDDDNDESMIPPLTAPPRRYISLSDTSSHAASNIPPEVRVSINNKGVAVAGVCATPGSSCSVRDETAAAAVSRPPYISLEDQLEMATFERY
jgi:hypothetical protein